ncbi:hypothetical protein [Microbacterium galbinum]|uniref:Uncharacterized protein n=1 Tax=Microbacterium galbinum TaxID=2851646 RepID=A0ABY4IPV9_9MICO|nr:hypothetical protein [Microbacterium galbinum]MCK2029570.1 hypothetical protein [Microbacterium galbinum]UPL14654.1 hypothetical protein KV396_09250 [Microbacterium galbinum]
MGRAEQYTTTSIVAAAAAAATAVRYQFGPGVSLSLIAAVVLLPVWWHVLARFRFARLLLALAAIAAVWGGVLTLFETMRPVSTSLLLEQTFTLLSLAGGIGVLLWARTQIGLGGTAVAFGVGALANVVLTGGNPANLWKYSLAVPVIIIVLGLTAMSGRRWLDLLALGALAVVCLASDSRSMTSFLLLAAVIVLWQMFMPPGTRRPRPLQTLVLLGVLSLAAFSLLQALILEGALGDAAQQRTQAQIDTSGSLIAGGRPELGAATALVAERPQGFGSGVLPVSHDVWIAKTGMSELNYDPDNGYVEGYMFGGQYEVHSVVGDLWLRFGPVGAIFAVALIGCAIYAVARSVSVKAAAGIAVWLVLLGAWDTFFSPLLTSSRTLALLFALTAIPVARLASRREASGVRARPDASPLRRSHG